MVTEAHEVAANLKADLSSIFTLDHALAHLDAIGMTAAEVGYQVRANTAEALLNRANAARRAGRKPFGPFQLSGNRFVTGPDRFSETIGDKPTHTVVVAELKFPTQTVAFADRDEMIACGHLLAAAPDMLAALKLLFAEQPYGATQAWRDNVKHAREACLAAIAKAEGRV